MRSTIRLTSASSGEPFSANTARAIRSLTEEVFQGRESFAGRDYLWTKLDDFHQKLETDVTVSSYSVGPSPSLLWQPPPSTFSIRSRVVT